MVLGLFRKKKEETIDTQIERIEIPIEPILKHTEDKKIIDNYINNNYIEEGLQATLTACGITYEQEDDQKKATYKINVKVNPEKDDKTKNQQSIINSKLPISPDIVFAIALSYKRILNNDNDFLNFFKENIGVALKYGVVVKTYEESDTTNEKRKLRNLTGNIKKYENPGLTEKYSALAQVANTAARKTSSFAQKYF